ncbi:3-oxoadipyl-CoA thiolase [Aliikangiella coralliicola]|uniref:Beta-ketoadipyl-CoA thiolase n=1 Tax=Aliikangiella coralliicola TaxID=2592383 RepID=A0A545TSQ1_9GAMM|nr:3-oxoadipyl-CoA thiolase [Aliikangiella coralliicola]TQV80254.1 3-oxoadipyl-CoA thiolase [Aliikangiella coralliicola]
MKKVYICDAIRTPIGRFGGSLSRVRADDLGAIPIKALMERNPQVNWESVDDVYYGCANQAGEDNRNVARMSSLLAGLPQSVPGMTINRLCGSGMDAIGSAARAIACGEQSLAIAGGVEQMSRAPLVMPKAESAFSRKAEIFDTTMGWRFVNKKMAENFGVDSMPETAENVAEQFNISREDQDLFALRTQEKTQRAQENGVFDKEIVPVTVKINRKETKEFAVDEHPRPSTLEGLAKLATPFRKDGTVTAGNASGINDGACALLLAAEDVVEENQLKPIARVVGMATSGVEPKIMGIGPVTATQKVLKNTGLSLEQMDVIELNEAFAAQGLAVLRELGVADDDKRVNPNGGAIALGHPLGMSGARLVTTAAYELQRREGKYALCTMCIGVGQGIALIIERV